MYRSSALKIVYLTAGAIMLLGVCFYIYKNFISADQLGSESIIDTTVSLKSGESKRIRLIIGKNSQIRIYNSFYSNCDHKMTGFEKEAGIAGVIDVSGRNMIEVSGPVGIHAENKQFFILDNKSCPIPVGFEKDGQIDYNIYSDEPSFLVQDLDGDGLADVASDWRDYDQNPLVNGIREVYLFDQISSSFKFSRLEYITFD